MTCWVFLPHEFPCQILLLHVPLIGDSVIRPTCFKKRGVGDGREGRSVHPARGRDAKSNPGASMRCVSAVWAAGAHVARVVVAGLALAGDGSVPFSDPGRARHRGDPVVGLAGVSQAWRSLGGHDGTAAHVAALRGVDGGPGGRGTRDGGARGAQRSRMFPSHPFGGAPVAQRMDRADGALTQAGAAARGGETGSRSLCGRVRPASTSLEPWLEQRAQRTGCLSHPTCSQRRGVCSRKSRSTLMRVCRGSPDHATPRPRIEPERPRRPGSEPTWSFVLERDRGALPRVRPPRGDGRSPHLRLSPGGHGGGRGEGGGVPREARPRCSRSLGNAGRTGGRLRRSVGTL